MDPSLISGFCSLSGWESLTSPVGPDTNPSQVRSQPTSEGWKAKLASAEEWITIRFNSQLNRGSNRGTCGWKAEILPTAITIPSLWSSWKLLEILCVVLCSSKYLCLKINFFRDLSNTSEKTTSINRYWKLATNQSIYKGVSRLEKIVIKDTFFANPSFWRYLLLSLPNIRQLIGVEWVAACDQCNISKVDAVQAVQLQNNSQHLSKMKLFYARGNTEADDSGNICAAPRFFLEWEASYESPRRFLSPGYMLQCYCSSSDCVTKRFKHLTDILRLVRILFNSLYFVGAVALTLNLVIVVIILGSKPLRKLPIMILIFNMAVCDMLMSVYCILIARYSVEVFQDSTFFNSLNLSKSFCRAKDFIFTVAQNVSVINSVLATIEKYLVIVYPMKPGRRMTKKISLISMCVTWLVSIGYSVDAVFYLNEKDEQENDRLFNHFYCSTSGRHIFQIPFVLSNQQVKMPMPLSLFIGVLYSFFFLCTVPLNIHIYIVVKKSSTQMGVKREGVLARKLALLVFTNFIFSVVPLSLAPLVSSRNLLVLDFFNPLMRTYHSFQAYLICIVWLPVLLLSLNCCLNPFLFTFRHHRFQMEFRHFASKCINKV